MTSIARTNVLVIGAGVAGLTASALLARQGVSAITVSEYASTANGPRAHITNQRTLEIMRDLVRIPAWGTRIDRKSDYEASSPTSMVNIAQHRFEPIILRRAVELGADIRFLNELLEIKQHDSEVAAKIAHRPSGDVYEIRAKYVIGADGGSSTVAKQLGFNLEGEAQLGFAINAWVEADLSKYVAHRPGTLYWTNHPGRDFFFGSGTFALVQEWDEWLVQFSYDPAAEDLPLTEEAIMPRIKLAIGDDSIPVKINSLNKWDMKHIVADSYRRGRAFLAGDAAHRHPPANGLGSNTSIQDTYNISWKLAAVVRGHADPDLLDTYNSERQPVGKQVIDRAIASVPLSADISRFMGVVAGQSVEEGWAALDAMFAPTEQGAAQRRQLRQALDAGQYGSHCHGVEMQQRYDTNAAAIVDDGTPWPEPERDPELYYHPTTHPGAYLPHVWLVHDGARINTLDLVPADTWTLITGHTGDGWCERSSASRASSASRSPRARSDWDSTTTTCTSTGRSPAKSGMRMSIDAPRQVRRVPCRRGPVGPGRHAT